MTKIQVGSKVQGFYCEVPYSGIVTRIFAIADPRLRDTDIPDVIVKLDAPIDVFGILREEVGIHHPTSNTCEAF